MRGSRHSPRQITHKFTRETCQSWNLTFGLFLILEASADVDGVGEWRIREGPFLQEATERQVVGPGRQRSVTVTILWLVLAVFIC